MKVELVRNRKRTVYCDGDIVRINEEVRGLCITFSDDAGHTVSVAFDGRCDKDGYDDEFYRLYRDCPVRAVNQPGGPMTDRAAMVALRDALNKLELGE
jgi:hypothetical protein